MNPIMIIPSKDATEEDIKAMSDPAVIIANNLVAVCQRLDVLIELNKRVKVDPKILKV